MPSLSPPTHLRFRLLQPELHVHLSVHRGGGGKVLVGLLAFARAPVQRAEAKVAVGDERAHFELGGKGHGGGIVRFGRRHIWAAKMGGNLAEEPERPRLIASFTTPAGELYA